jgi:Zn-dependent protease
MPQALFVCTRCGNPLAQEALVCGQCHALVHRDELERLSNAAEAHEAQSEWQLAHGEWLKTLELLPKDSKQAEWVRAHAAELGGKAAAAQREAGRNRWVRRFGPLAPVLILLVKGKTLLFSIFKLKFIFSLAAFMAVYWHLFGMKFGIGFTVGILIHELGHYIDIKRRGLPAEMPVFLPGLGAYVQWNALGVSRETRAQVSLAGPLAGLIAAAACAAVWWKTREPLWAALARAGAWLNLLNLIPVWVLDGSQATLALSKNARVLILGMCLTCWYAFSEGAYLLVACGFVYRLFTKDSPDEPGSGVAGYFVFLVIALGAVLWLMPGAGPGI